MFLGVLVECDPSIKAIILKIDQDKHDYIVKETQLARLKVRLSEVWKSMKESNPQVC